MSQAMLNPKQWYDMMVTLAGKHPGEMESSYLDFRTIQLWSPRYETKYDQLVPMVVIDWK